MKSHLNSLAFAQALAAILVAIAVAGCPDPEPPPPEEPPSEPIPVSGVPDAIPPTEPGFLELGPPGLILEPGQTAQLYTRLYDSAGTVTVPADAATIEVLTPDVLELSNGVLTARALGVGQVRAFDGSHGEQVMEVQVVEDAPDGPTAIVFEAPVLSVQAGQRRPVTFTLLDAKGAAISATVPVELRVEGTAALALDNGELVAIGPGLGNLVASLPGTQPVALAGRALVASWAPNAGSCESVPWQVSCEPVARPIEFYSKGVASQPLRIEVIRVKGCAGFQMERWQTSPTRVDIADGRVLNLSGTLVSANPGRTSYRMFYEDTECTQASLNGAPCAWNAAVYPDLNGTWSASCEGGDTGSVTIAEWRRNLVRVATPHQAVSPFNAPVYGTSACFSNPDGFSCSNDHFAVNARWSTDACGAEGFLCSDSSEKCEGTLGDCAASRNLGTNGDPTPLQVEGWDTLKQGRCTYARGGSSSCRGPSSGSFKIGMTSYQATQVVGREPALFGDLEVELQLGATQKAVVKFGGTPAVGHYESSDYSTEFGNAPGSLYFDGFDLGYSHAQYCDTVLTKGVLDIDELGAEIAGRFSFTDVLPETFAPNCTNCSAGCATAEAQEACYCEQVEAAAVDVVAGEFRGPYFARRCEEIAYFCQNAECACAADDACGPQYDACCGARDECPECETAFKTCLTDQCPGIQPLDSCPRK